MRFQYFYPVLVASFILALFSSLAVAKTPEQIFEQVSPSVVVVDIFDSKDEFIGQGSGVVIGTGQVITNCHVAKRGKSRQVRQSGKTFSATMQYSDPSRDLCQLNVPDLRAPPVVLGTAKKLKVGQRVYAIGAPEDLELTLSEGLISSLRPHEGSDYIQTSAAISLGSSGGGLFDDQGQLIGITTFYHAEGQNLNFALPVDWVGELQKRA
ncbi:MAG: S1C family serine protease, partial [Pseudomonadota bacterium]|nr:S1C family serine protease [Pseudomonadota bacterium]